MPVAVAGAPVASLGLLADVQTRLEELARQYDVPGASVGLLDGREVHEFTTGILNLSTGVTVTPESLFQIGSITKVLTATLVMQLVDEGWVDLDDPIGRHLPELRLADERAASAVTLRYLLTHTSGIESDHFEDFGRGDDASQRFVDSCSRLGLIHPPGAMYSYCNSGFLLLGRVVERLRRCTWEEAVRSHICRPLGLRRLATLPEEAVLHRVAVGHFRTPDNPLPRVTTIWSMPRSQAASGGTVCASALDLLSFATCHMAAGSAVNGSSILSASSVAAMQERLVDIPSPAPSRPAQGLGWEVLDWSGERVLHHGGATVGQTASLWLFPSQRVAVAVLANSLGGGRLADQFVREVVPALTGMQAPPSAQPPAGAADLDVVPYLGRYERLNSTAQVIGQGGQLVLELAYSGSVAALFGTSGGQLELRPADPRTFFVVGPPDLPFGAASVMFLDFRQGRPRYLFCNGRVNRRAPEEGGSLYL